MAGTEGVTIEPFAAPLPGELVVTKRTFDAFADTELEAALRSRGVKALLIAGLETSVCILFSAAAAYGRRFVPLLAADACADEEGRHEATLSRYGGLCFQTVTTVQATDDWPSVCRLAARFAS